MSGKIKATVVDRAEAIARKVMTKVETAIAASNWSRADLAKAAGITSADVEALFAGQGGVQPWIAVMNTLRLELSTLAEGDYLAQRLLSTRDRKGLSADEIAQETGLSVAAIEDLENGLGELRDLFLLLVIIAPRVGCRKAKKGFGKRDKVDSDSRFTSPEFLEAIDIAFGDIDVDPCGHMLSPVVAGDRIMLSDGRDGMLEDWQFSTGTQRYALANRSRRHRSGGSGGDRSGCPTSGRRVHDPRAYHFRRCSALHLVGR